MQTFFHLKLISVDIIHNKVPNDTICKNRLKLCPIIKTVLYFCKTNILLCGHRDDSKYYEMIGTGSFQTFLYFRVESGGPGRFSDSLILRQFDIPKVGQTTLIYIIYQKSRKISYSRIRKYFSATVY